MANTELFQRGLDQLKAGNYEEARKLFRENEEKAGTAAATMGLIQNADAKLTAGDVSSASKLYEQALDRNPSLPEVYLGLARVALFTQQFDEAMVHATAATRLAPRQGLSWTLLGLVHEARGDAAGSLENLHKGARMSPGVFLCMYNLGRVLAQQGDFSGAIAALSTATTLEPGNADAFYALGVALKESGQVDKALGVFEQVTELAPKSIDAWATLADVRFSAKTYQAARDALDAGLAAVGEHPALLEKAAACCTLLGDADAAIGYVQRELAVAPDYERAWLNLASLQLATKAFDASEATAKKLLERKPDSWEAWFHLGNLYEAIPAEKEAETAYRKALALAKDNWKVLMNLATLLVQTTARDKHAEAVTLLERALKVAPAGEWRVHYNLALAFTRQGKKSEALALARKIQQEAPAADPMVAEAKKLEANLREARA